MSEDADGPPDSDQGASGETTGDTTETAADGGTAVDAETVEHIASLARVDVDEGDRERFAEQFADILSYFETLDEVPEIEAEPDLTNVMRPDEVTASLERDEALQNAPESEDGFFKGPRVS